MKDLAYKVVFDKVMELLAKGTAPWKVPYKGSVPYNGKSKHRYHGINFFVLMSMGYSDPRWFTFKQITEMGGTIEKGAKSVPVVFWKFLSVEDDKTGKNKTVPLLRYYNVFNAEQVKGVKLPELPKTCKGDKIAEADAVVNGYSTMPKIARGRPSYSPTLDVISMPERSTFTSDEEYYSTLFHEMTHSTGHKDRLNRDSLVTATTFGSEVYSFEELVAEMGAAFLANHAGITTTIENSASYIQGWSKYLASNPKALVQAASKAQKAADYILAKAEELAEKEDDVEITATQASLA